MTHTNLRDLFSDIADAIRAKTGGAAEIVADDFPTKIDEIVTPILQSKSATPSLSVQTITPTSPNNGLSSVSVGAITKELLATLDADFVAGNIKKDADLFGLIGTFAGGGLNGVYFGTITPTENTQILDFSSISTTFDSCVILTKGTSNNPAYKICTVTVSAEPYAEANSIVYLPSAGSSSRSAKRDGVSISSGVLTVTQTNPIFVSGTLHFYMLWNSNNSPFLQGGKI